MKKAIMLVCVLAMAFSAAGCGGNETEQPEAQQEMQQKETEEKQADDGVDKQAVYDYLNGLLESEDNPASREVIGFEDMDINSDEAKKIISDWQEECDEYEDKCAQETADKFGLTTDEVDTIFYEMVSELY